MKSGINGLFKQLHRKLPVQPSHPPVLTDTIGNHSIQIDANAAGEMIHLVLLVSNSLQKEDYENSKHQKSNFKQIPMTQIQNSEHTIHQHLCDMAFLQDAKYYGIKTAKLR